MNAPQPKKITILSTFFAPFTSGAEMCSQELAQYLGTEQKNTYQVTVVTGLFDATLPREEMYHGARVVRVGVGHKVIDKFLYPFFAVPAILRSAPDIAHAIMESYAGIALMMVALVKPSVRRVLTLQSGDLDEKAGKSIPSFLWKLIHQTPHHVTAISEFLKKRAQTLRRDNVSLIYNGVHLEELFSIAKETSLFGDGVIHIGCLARLSPEKGVQDLLASFVLVKKQMSAVHLHMVGDGAMRAELERYILENNLTDSVTLHGRLPHDEAMRVLAACDFVVVPSRAEGLGIAAIEALALRKPIVATRVGGLPDVVTDDVGKLVSVQDSAALCAAIIALCDNETRENLAQGTQYRARQFSWDKIFPQFLGVYEQMLRPRITIATGIYTPEPGGPAIYVPKIANYFREQGVATDVITYGNDETHRDAGVLVIPRGLLSKIQYFFAVLRATRRSSLIYVQDTVSSGFPVFLACKLTGTPYVLKAVGFQGYEKAYREGKTQATLEDFFTERHDFVISLVNYLGFLVARHATRVITPSEYLKNIVVKWGVSREKISVVYNGVSLPAQEESIAHFPEGEVILMYGRMVAHKGFEGVIDAVVALHEQGITTPLVIMGSGPYHGAIASYVAKKKAAQFIHILGDASRGQVLFALRRARVLVNNSSYEGFSHVLLEGALVGVPLLASRVGGNGELVKDGDNGFLFELHDTETLKERLHAVCTDDALNQRLRYTNNITEFSHTSMCEHTLQVLYACVTP